MARRDGFGAPVRRGQPALQSTAMGQGPPSTEGSLRFHHLQDLRASSSTGLRPSRRIIRLQTSTFWVPSISFDNLKVRPEVWVYDVDWAPPEGQLGDSDGYQGRLKVRYRQSCLTSSPSTETFRRSDTIMISTSRSIP
jgi:hypothetical protein